MDVAERVQAHFSEWCSAHDAANLELSEVLSRDASDHRYLALVFEPLLTRSRAEAVADGRRFAEWLAKRASDLGGPHIVFANDNPTAASATPGQTTPTEDAGWTAYVREEGQRVLDRALEFARNVLASLEKPPFEMYHALSVGEDRSDLAPQVVIIKEKRNALVDLDPAEVAEWIARRFEDDELGSWLIGFRSGAATEAPVDPATRIERLWNEWDWSRCRMVVRPRVEGDERTLDVILDDVARFEPFRAWLQEHHPEVLATHVLRVAPEQRVRIDHEADDDTSDLEHGCAFARAWLNRLRTDLDLRHVIYADADSSWPRDRPHVLILRDDASAEVRLDEQEICDRILLAYARQHPDRPRSDVSWYADYCK